MTTSHTPIDHEASPLIVPRESHAHGGESRREASLRRDPRARQCCVCGASLRNHREDAVYCGGPCRAEASRLRAILSLSSTAAYASLAERNEARQKRTWRATDARIHMDSGVRDGVDRDRA
jgi:hypothetical protein